YGSERFLIADLCATNDKMGLGNLVFELIGTIALARKLNRTLVVRKSAYEKMEHKYGELPNIISKAAWNISNDMRLYSKVFDFSTFHCCRFNPAVECLETKMQPLITFKASFLQSFKYFESLPQAEV
ncbi:hypothetical protein PFISCL1PPCAC_3509, partial [Pristionchus fissidentatus]